MPPTPTPWVPNRYPAARRVDHVDVYKSEKQGEVRVHDPYHWLEQNTDETEQWTTAQEKFTRDFLDQNPERKDLEDQIQKSMDYAKVRRVFWMLVPFAAAKPYSSLQFPAPSLKDDGRWYWYYNTGLQAQSGESFGNDAQIIGF